MKYKYVVIEREYGGRGAGIGKLLSERSGIPRYGSGIIESVSKSLNASVAEIQKYEESVIGSLSIRFIY